LITRALYIIEVGLSGKSNYYFLLTAYYFQIKLKIFRVLRLCLNFVTLIVSVISASVRRHYTSAGSVKGNVFPLQARMWPRVWVEL